MTAVSAFSAIRRASRKPGEVVPLRSRGIRSSPFPRGSPSSVPDSHCAAPPVRRSSRRSPRPSARLPPSPSAARPQNRSSRAARQHSALLARRSLRLIISSVIGGSSIRLALANPTMPDDPPMTTPAKPPARYSATKGAPGGRLRCAVELHHARRDTTTLRSQLRLFTRRSVASFWMIHAVTQGCVPMAPLASIALRFSSQVTAELMRRAASRSASRSLPPTLASCRRSAGRQRAATHPSPVTTP